jgi:hypothetical protein
MKLDQLLLALKAGQPVNGSVSERCAVGLAAGRHGLLPEPYTEPREAWRRLNDEQRAWVRRINPEGAGEVEVEAQHAKTAWH